MFEDRLFECERCGFKFDSMYVPEIEYDGETLCFRCFHWQVYKDCDEMRKSGNMLRIETWSVGIEAPELTDEEYLQVITVI